MKVEMGRMPGPEEIAAIEWEARRMRAEMVMTWLRAGARRVARLFGREGSRDLPEPSARA
jgi:hypothetical protein